MAESNSLTTAYDAAVLGCGLMGAALVRTLAKSGRSVAVWNRTHDRAVSLAGDGITPVRTVGDAVDSSRLIVACMSTYDCTISALDSVADWTGVTLVNVASGAPEEAEALARWAGERGAQYLDGSIVCYPRDIGTPKGAILYSGSLDGWTAHWPTLMSLGDGSAYVSEKVTDASVLNVGIVGAFYVAALSAYVEAATYVLSNGVSVELLNAVTPVALESLRKEAAEAAISIDTGDHVTDQATIDTYTEATRAALAVMQGSGQRARVLQAATENLTAASEFGLGSLGFYAQTKIVGADSVGQN